MVVYFNELTLDRAPQQNYRLLNDFKSIWAEFVKVVDKKIKRMILPHSAMAKLYEAVSSSRDPAMFDFLHFFSTKFREAPEDEFSPHADDRFNGAEYYIELDDGKKVECKSLGWAALNKSITLGLQSSKFWRRFCYDIEEESIEYGTSKLKAICVTGLDHISRAEVKTWIAEYIRDVKEPSVVLERCDMPIAQKTIKIGDDHGKDVLMEFSRRLVCNEYVVGIIKSLPFNADQPRSDYKPQEVKGRFIEYYDATGVIDIRLHWTNVNRHAFGIKVKTTGRNLQETREIAKILKDKYDRTS